MRNSTAATRRSLDLHYTCSPVSGYACTVYGQNGDTEIATEMAIFKAATNLNNTYSSSEAYIIDCRLYTLYSMQLLSYMKKVQ